MLGRYSFTSISYFNKSTKLLPKLCIIRILYLFDEWMVTYVPVPASHFFLHLTYDELVNITEPQLEHLNITKVSDSRVGERGDWGGDQGIAQDIEYKVGDIMEIRV